MIQGMNHFTVLTDDLDKTLGFYVDLLGLKPGPRPDLGFPAPGCTRATRPYCTSSPGGRTRAARRRYRSHGVFRERPGGRQGKARREKNLI